jgi:hypothetical protein
MDTARSYTYMLRQPGGLGKLLIAGLLLFVPLLGWALVGGYVVRTTRRVALGNEDLPEWTDFGALLVQGILAWVGLLIYGIPGTILGTLGGVGDTLSFLWGLVVLAVFPAAVTRYAVTDDFGSFFKFEEIWRYIQDNLNNYLTAVVMALLAGIIAGFGIILLVLGVVFTIAWSMLAAAHLYGSVWARQRAQDAPKAVEPPRADAP